MRPFTFISILFSLCVLSSVAFPIRGASSGAPSHAQSESAFQPGDILRQEGLPDTFFVFLDAHTYIPAFKENSGDSEVLRLNQYIDPTRALSGNPCACGGRVRDQLLPSDGYIVVIKVDNWRYNDFFDDWTKEITKIRSAIETAVPLPAFQQGDILQRPDSENPTLMQYWIVYEPRAGDRFVYIKVVRGAGGVSLHPYLPPTSMLFREDLKASTDMSTLPATSGMTVAVEAEHWNNEGFFTEWKAKQEVPPAPVPQQRPNRPRTPPPSCGFMNRIL